MFNQTERINNVFHVMEMVRMVASRDSRYVHEKHVVEFDLTLCTSAMIPVMTISLQHQHHPKVMVALQLDYSREDFAVGTLGGFVFQQDNDVGRISLPDVPHYILDTLYNKVKEGNT
jgi:hypothetical protein